MTSINIAYNAVVAKIMGASNEVLHEISGLLSYKVAGAEFTQAMKNGGWDGRSSFFSFRALTFPAGFVGLVQAHLQSAGHTVRVVSKPLPGPLGPERPVVDAFGDDPNYDYQRETVERLVRHGRLISQLATGSGKSRVAKLAYARIKRPTLFLTTRSVLMYQMKEQVEQDMGVKVGVLGDSEWSPRAGFNVGMVQTLAAALKAPTVAEEIARLRAREATEAQKSKAAYAFTDGAVLRRRAEKNVARQTQRRAKTRELLARFELVILEEAHESAGNSYYEILSHCRNAFYRLALTATPFMKDDEEANMRLMACAGPVGIRVTERLLIDRGILARPYFRFLATAKPPKLYRGTSWQRAYKIGIVENEARNQAIVAEIAAATKYGLTAMVLVQHKAHGALLQRQIAAAGLSVRFIFGEHDQAQRRAALDALAKGHLQVLIGSNILDVGVDVPAVGMIVLAGGGKAEVSLRQRIGRGLRRKKIGPNVAFVVDFDDAHNSHLREHAGARRGIIAGTDGFAENILPAGAAFDYAGLGFHPVR